MSLCCDTPLHWAPAGTARPRPPGPATLVDLSLVQMQTLLGEERVPRPAAHGLLPEVTGEGGSRGWRSAAPPEENEARRRRGGSAAARVPRGSPQRADVRLPFCLSFLLRPFISRRRGPLSIWPLSDTDPHLFVFCRAFVSGPRFIPMSRFSCPFSSYFLIFFHFLWIPFPFASVYSPPFSRRRLEAQMQRFLLRAFHVGEALTPANASEVTCRKTGALWFFSCQ